MFRATTPELKFILEGVDLSECDALKLTLEQGNRVISKNLSQVEIEGSAVICRLTQQETASLEANKPLYAQIRFKVDNEVLASAIETLSVHDVLNSEVL